MPLSFVAGTATSRSLRVSALGGSGGEVMPEWIGNCGLRGDATGEGTVVADSRRLLLGFMRGVDALFCGAK